MNTKSAQIVQTRSGCPRVWLQKMPPQIEIANSFCRTDIFQLDARKGQALYLKARVGGDAVVTEIWQGHSPYKCVITPVVGVLEQILEVIKE